MFFKDEILQYFKIGKLTKGNYFGELGLHFNRPRSASILSVD
jgi:CRP-like cAMP-binding protein